MFKHSLKRIFQLAITIFPQRTSSENARLGKSLLMLITLQTKDLSDYKNGEHPLPSTIITLLNIKLILMDDK